MVKRGFPKEGKVVLPPSLKDIESEVTHVVEKLFTKLLKEENLSGALPGGKDHAFLLIDEKLYLATHGYYSSEEIVMGPETHCLVLINLKYYFNEKENDFSFHFSKSKSVKRQYFLISKQMIQENSFEVWEVEVENNFLEDPNIHFEFKEGIAVGTTTIIAALNALKISPFIFM